MIGGVTNRFRGGKGRIPLTGQTGLSPRRVVERRLQLPPEIAADKVLPERRRRHARLRAPIPEPFCAKSDMADLVGIDAVEDAGGSLVAAAMSFGSVLSLPFALRELEADIAAALDGTPATPVASAVRAGLAP